MKRIITIEESDNLIFLLYPLKNYNTNLQATLFYKTNVL